MTLAPSLPGIAFETVPRPLDATLPRMDVCGFVGFASSGPIDVPVLVEDAVSFRNVFGGDPVLARNDDGTPVYAHLGPAVEAFFANGGVRAWVVRVAATGPGGAVTNRFTVPGLIDTGARDGSADGWRLVQLPARAPGAWSDALTVAASLEIESSVAVSFGEGEVVVDHGIDVGVGDIVALDLDDGRSVLVEAGAVVRRADGIAVTFDPSLGWIVSAGVIPGVGGDARLLTAAGPIALAGFALESGAGPTVIAVEASDPVVRGDLIALERSGDVLTLLTIGDERTHPDVPVDGRRRFVVDTFHAVGPLAAGWTADPALVPSGPVIIEVQRVRLAVDDGNGAAFELRALGLGDRHPRSLSALPDDELAYTVLAGLPRPDHSAVDAHDIAVRRLTAFEQELVQPRFPLAAPAASATMLPLGLPIDPTATVVGPRPAEVASADPAARNGLASFDAGVFVDPDVAGAGVDTVVPLAFDVTSVQSPPRRLRGLHALVTNDDVTLVCVPDAVHTGWDRIEVPVPPPLVAPVLTSEGVDERGADWAWTAVLDADDYQLELDGSPHFELPVRSEIAATSATTEPPSGCPAPAYARVRARRGSELGPWSNVAAAIVPQGTFGPCSPPEVPPPAEPDDVAPQPPDVLWRARTPAEAAPWPELRALQLATLRWCAGRGDVLAVLSLPRAFTTSAALAHVGVLRHGGPAFDEQGRPVDAPFLAGGVPVLTDAESGVLAYGALFHPWPISGWPGGGDTRAEPPDGAVAGTIAARAIERGAWVAPARRPLRSVVALTPTIGDGDVLQLARADVNPIAHDPSGFMTLTMSTMSDVAASRPVNVRRLVMLLRRLARREGVGIVFEPHDEELRHLVRMRFERLLTEMYRRGAFAGANTAEAFEVSTGRSVNPPGSVDTGRFVVEVRIAPSRPLEYLIVRLVIGGTAGAEVAEVAP